MPKPISRLPPTSAGKAGTPRTRLPAATRPTAAASARSWPNRRRRPPGERAGRHHQHRAGLRQAGRAGRDAQVGAGGLEQRRVAGQRGAQVERQRAGRAAAPAAARAAGRFGRPSSRPPPVVRLKLSSKNLTYGGSGVSASSAGRLRAGARRWPPTWSTPPRRWRSAPATGLADPARLPGSSDAGHDRARRRPRRPRPTLAPCTGCRRARGHHRRPRDRGRRRPAELIGAGRPPARAWTATTAPGWLALAAAFPPRTGAGG